MGINQKKKKLLIEFVDGICQDCHDEFNFEELEIHKINPELGYNDFKNLKVLCVGCHKRFSSAQNMARGIC